MALSYVSSCCGKSLTEVNNAIHAISRMFLIIQRRKFWTRKFWQITCNLPNSQKFSPSKILYHTVVSYCFTILISHLTWMQTLSSSLDSSTCLKKVGFLPLVNAGSTASAWYSATRSPILNPLSAKTKSPSKSWLNMLIYSLWWSLYLKHILPRFRNEWDGSLWCNSNQVFHCVMRFI